MADTTTPNLALTKIGVGGSRDSWGDKLNGNMDKIDAAVKAAGDTAGAALPKAGGTLTGDLKRAGEGALPRFNDPAMTAGRIFLTPATGTDPTSLPGDLWLGYTP